MNSKITKATELNTLRKCVSFINTGSLIMSYEKVGWNNRNINLIPNRGIVNRGID